MERLEHFVRAVLGIGEDVGLVDVLSNIVPAARDLLGAQYAALGVLSDEGEFLEEFLHDGIDEETAARIGALPRGHGLLGLLITHPEPIRLPNLAEHPASYGFPPHHPPMTSFLGTPIRIGDRVFGNLYLTDKLDANEFSAEDEELAVALASVAGMVIENARLYEEAREQAAELAAADRELGRLAVIEDRERIGRELHDTVVQRLFSAGMALQGALQQVDPERPQVAARVNEVIDDLDATIRQIRTAIFELQSTGDQPAGVRASLSGVVAEAARLLGRTPEMIMQGPIDTLVTPELGDHAVSVLRESLANVVRHAKAEQSWVRVVVDTTGLVVEVTDDGVGPPEDVLGGRGLTNMRRRAKMLGGDFHLERQDGRTTMTWKVPLS